MLLIVDMIMITTSIISIRLGLSRICPHFGTMVRFTPGMDTHTTRIMTTVIRHTIIMAITNRADIIRILPPWKAPILQLPNSIRQAAKKTPQLLTIGAINS